VPSSAILAENLGKKYIIHHHQREHYTALRDVLANQAKSVGRRIVDLGSRSPNIQPSSREELWALKNVSFKVQPGERLGVIGRNGAGKSTLLKLLSRITKPSEGRISLRGRVASLLEVGTGFHPELTGRENIYLNGAILGMKKEEIRRQFDEIVAFAEVENFLDTPVKRYSSGMYVRLAFAVAAHLQTEILLVDEVLAVGDAAFQKKCLGKMSDISETGKTIIFVSHNMGAISGLCQRGLLLQSGCLYLDGDIDACIRQYTSTWAVEDGPILDLKRMRRVHHGALRQAATLESAKWQREGHAWRVAFHEMPVVDFEVRVSKPLESLELGIAIYNQNMIEVASSLSTDSLETGRVSPGDYRLHVDMSGLQLMPGTYAVGLGLKSGSSDFVMEDYLSEALHFEVLDSEESARMRTHARRGAVLPMFKYSFTPEETGVGLDR